MPKIAMACIALLGLVGVLSCSTGKDKVDDTVRTGEIADVAADTGESDVCQPDCFEKECGDDGCGGTCGECPENWYCSGFGPVTYCATDCDYLCDELVECGWVDFYIPDGCDCGDCPFPQADCLDNVCVCEPKCPTGKCGDDGCGGSCGDCDEGMKCSTGGYCVECFPDCAGKECGDDGCGGSCGECDAYPTCAMAECTAEGQCITSVQEGFCLVDGVCHNEGTQHPEDPCLFCSPSDSQLDWSDAPNGMPCGGGKRCQDGLCCGTEGNLIDDASGCCPDLAPLPQAIVIPSDDCYFCCATCEYGGETVCAVVGDDVCMPWENSCNSPDCSCYPLGDQDADGYFGAADNCPTVPNPGQEDNDDDGMGDVCDPDDDNDQVSDEEDCEPYNSNVYPGQEEFCNCHDDNCDGVVDEGYADSDGDGNSDCCDPGDDDGERP